MARSVAPPKARAALVGALAALLVGAWALAGVPGAGAAGVEALKGKLEGARAEAGELAESLRQAQEQLSSARSEAASATAHEERLDRLLAEGEAHEAELRERVTDEKRRLRRERRRLERARAALADRLVSIYEGGSPSEASVILSASDYEELTTRAEYLAQIRDSDAALAGRVAAVRDSVRGRLSRISQLEERAVAYDERLSAARSQIASVRSDAEAAAGRLHALAGSRAESLATLKSRIGDWVKQIEAAEAASREAAEETVGRWLGGPYSIPTYIVMCESGGDYGAVNPASGAGGAYQILPSTWALYGGQGAPQDAPKSEQDQIAAEIWADSGGSAWVCAG